MNTENTEPWVILWHNGRLVVRQGTAVVFSDDEPLTESQWQSICQRVNFCSGIHIETLTLLNQADHPTLTQIYEENQSLRKQLAEAKEGEAYSDKLLCSLWDKLGARGKIDEQDSAVDRIRDLIVAEDERDALRANLAKNKAASKALLEAVQSLGEQSMDGPIYFEASPSKDPECFKRWKALNDAGVELRALIQPEEKK